MDYGTGVRLHRPFTQAVEAVTTALQDQGFGVLTTVDARATPREKIGAELEDHRILGARSPALDTLRG
ncbi:DUF302 domain-containing protein [Kitasatospora xanthocidica]|uniref:DUF302 domain-containing protein n=1 Tax=Kitasatospora xanthocidica TaxID=83382 RepID=UPI0036E7DF26